MSKLDLLTVNDKAGEYPASQYAAGITETPRPALEGEVKADVCIIGGGFTGLSAALTLSELGMKVVVLEAQRAGFGASGRNGGQIGTGQRIEPAELVKKFGAERGKELFDLGVAAHDHVLETIAKHRINIGYQPGVAHLGFHKSDIEHAKREIELLNETFNYKKLELVDQSNMPEYISSDRYQGGTCDWGAGHGDPLALALGIAKAAEKQGATIYENSRVTNLEPTPSTAQGNVVAPITILACNGYLGELHPKTARYVMPINNFIVATKPLGEERARALMPKNTAIADTKFVVNYFRISPDHRLLFGGGESYGYRFPKELAAKARDPMLEIFPQLKNVEIDFAWGGTLAITMSRLPYVAREGAIYISSGYSGHGVALATYMGHLIAHAINGDIAGFDLMAAIPHKKFPGNSSMRHPLLVAAMLWYQLRDKVGL